MNEGAAMLTTKNEFACVTVALNPEIHAEVKARAAQNDMGLNRTILQLLRAGIESENQKKQRLEEMLRLYRECTDPREAERLSNELGAMIFGR
jgi:hypothetical protein